MSESPLPDPLEQFLQQPPSVAPSSALRDSLLTQTTQALPKRRWRRRWPALAGAAALIALALVSAYFGLRSLHVEPVPQFEVVEQKIDLPPEPPQAVAATAPMNPVELEWSAFDAEDEPQRARLYFQAGDLYLDKHQNYEAALRCYHQALTYCDVRELEYNPDDNWLVMALKRDKRKDQ